MRATRLIRETINRHRNMYYMCELDINETYEKDSKELHLKYKANNSQNSVYIKLSMDECRVLAKQLYRDIHQIIELDDARVKKSLFKPFHSPVDYQPEVATVDKNATVELPNQLTFESKMNYER